MGENSVAFGYVVRCHRMTIQEWTVYCVMLVAIAPNWTDSISLGEHLKVLSRREGYAINTT